jgi:hypothetical protein
MVTRVRAECGGNMEYIPITYKLKSSEAGYDESKPLCRFIWEMFTGFSWVEGYREYDPIEKTIEGI